MVDYHNDLNQHNQYFNPVFHSKHPIYPLNKTTNHCTARVPIPLSHNPPNPNYKLTNTEHFLI